MNIVQIGCHDGNDHVFDFISQNSSIISKAILVEPIPENLKKARLKYKDFNFVEFREIAIVDNENKEEISFFCPEDLKHSQTASTDIKHVLRHESNVKELKVKCKSISKFLQEINFPIIDRLYIDAEGLDCTIIKQINFSKHDIRYIEYEYIHSDGSYHFGSNGIQVEQMLLNLGFKKTKNTQFNVIFVREDS